MKNKELFAEEESLKQQDPGFGTQYEKNGSRVMNPDGSYNIKRVGGVRGYKDMYKHLIEMPTWRFMLIFVLLYLITNVVFAALYMWNGINQLYGIESQQNEFLQAFYFSTQTFTTVGYGGISPVGNGASIIASLEAFVGLISFSVLTGLIYGRFSKPQARIGFSKNIILTNFNEGKALMFKIVNLRDNALLNTSCEVIVSMKKESSDHHTFSRTYDTLKLEVNSVRFFPLTWTIVHELKENSPFANKTYEEILVLEPQLFILVKAHDETFAHDVLQKHSYVAGDWVQNVKFKRSFYAEESGRLVLNIKELNAFEPI